jgi:hypothetical protein
VLVYIQPSLPDSILNRRFARGLKKPYGNVLQRTRLWPQRAFQARSEVSKVVLWEARFPQNAKAVKGVFPTVDGSPFFGQISGRQIHHLQDGVFAKKRDPRPDRFTQAQVERFYGVGGVDNLAETGKEG